MESVSQELHFLDDLAKGIAAQFGDNCEVVVHDLTRPYDSTIVAIENGHVTGRKVGDPGTNLGLEILRGTTEGDNRHNFVTHTKDGRLLRSTSLYMRNPAGQIIGAICINFDITDLTAAESALHSLTASGLQPVRESFVSNVNDLLDTLIQEANEVIGKPPALMSKDDKIKIIQLLDEKGAFLIKKAGEKICAYLGISKYTLYSYLEESKSAGTMET
ncbi:helix-turn-helix transcriptional regulator [Paenibacillus sp. sptzw28]|uniref:helix-turn-helix transcriptional regulator n=1 Tax=Paenibacillus sp. sptzw28 TaxID=715179 RepID=UPI001C6EAEF1|nr:helix-turn-helix transcriptional regulator [Paenibacillus sp. sptzw28]QYR20766.1 helix-turn-helix transcriptional regulator [Paenibacillus sp. sptzw28]